MIKRNPAKEKTKKEKTMPTNRVYIICFLIPFFLIACDNNRVYDEYIPIKNQKWDKDVHAIFRVSIHDTINPHNIFINVRNAANYKFANLFLFITVSSPNGNSVTDTFNCVLADEKGKWYGNGYGDLYDNRILYKSNVFFPDTGTYIFDIVQAMREDVLENISDVGIRIERKTK
ncbi:MAG: gliding motility lipoprotein GldH [Marinilabiliales bacterium]